MIGLQKLIVVRKLQVSSQERGDRGWRDIMDQSVRSFPAFSPWECGKKKTVGHVELNIRKLEAYATELHRLVDAGRDVKGPIGLSNLRSLGFPGRHEFTEFFCQLFFSS